MPVVALREWLTGMRPVVGAFTASGLMLLGCSWFAFNPGGLDAGQSARTPGAVRINDAGETSGETHALRPARSTPTPRVEPRHMGSRQAPAKATATRTPVARDVRDGDSSPAAPAAKPGATQAPAQATSTSKPSSSTPTAVSTDPPGVTVTTPTLPPPLDGVPTVTVTTPAVPVPPVPNVSLPDVPTITTKLGLP